MAIDNANINSLWGSLLVEELIRNGVDYFCIAPGSRSTPITVAIARHREARNIICYDERAAAFHALGYARATNTPAVVVCTSGTAIANCLPAVVEASTDAVPMLLISADRPPELRDNGSNQTIQQVGILSSYTRWQFDLPCPDEQIPARMVLTTVDQAVYRSRHSLPGPVHLNCMFREPLAPSKAPISEHYTNETSLARWQRQQRPFTQYHAPLCVPHSDAIQQLHQTIAQSKKGILAIGRTDFRHYRTIGKLAYALSWPIFADITAATRFTAGNLPNIYYFDQLLLNKKQWQQYRPDTILHIGGQFVSKRFLQFVEQCPPDEYILVDEQPQRHDPNHLISRRFQADIAPFCETLLDHIDNKTDTTYPQTLLQRNTEVGKTIDEYITTQKFGELVATRAIAEHLPKQTALFLASSMPVRYMDMYAGQREPLPIAANRGASGIDGTIASALGFSAGLNRPVTLIIGDLALLHDLNSLSLIHSCPHPLWIIVYNNGGGGIFSFLPIAQFPDVFDKYFTTPHNWEFSKIAATFDLLYACTKNREDFTNAYQLAVRENKPCLIEIPTTAEDSHSIVKGLQERITSLLF